MNAITEALSTGRSEDLPDNISPLGYGDDAAAFLCKMPEEAVVVKKYHDTDNRDVKVLRGINALKLAKGIRGLEQLVATFPDQGIVITRYEMGRDLTAISVDEAEQIPAEHIQDVAKTLTEMHEKGLSTDTNAKNFIYDPERGFAIIDFHRDEDGQAPQILPQKLTSFIKALEYSPTFSLKDKYSDMKPADFASFARRVT